jgi:hypothetical protein
MTVLEIEAVMKTADSGDAGKMLSTSVVWATPKLVDTRPTGCALVQNRPPPLCSSKYTCRKTLEEGPRRRTHVLHGLVAKAEARGVLHGQLAVRWVALAYKIQMVRDGEEAKLHQAV